MRPQDAEKLLGGYATDTLTEAERQALFEAALANQDLFNALANEQALRELLSDPRCRRRLLGLLKPRKEPFYHRFVAWLKRPAPWALAGSVAVMLLIMTAVLRLNRPAATLPPAAQAPVQIAQKVSPASPEVAPPPPPQLEKKKQRAPAARPQPAPVREMQLAEKAETLATAPPPPADKPGLVAAVLPAPPAAPAETPKELAPPSFQAQVAAAPKGVGFKAMAEQEAYLDARALYYASPLRLRDVGAAPLVAQEARKAPSSRGALDLRRAETKAAGGAAPLQPLPGALGLRYSILRKGAGGQYSAVDPEALFQPGDSIRLSVEANQTGYLSVLRQDAAGAWGLLHQIQIQQRIGQTIPSSGAITLAPQPGQERLLLVFSRSPKDEFQDLAQPNRKLIIQKVPSEAATYVVDAGPDPASRLRVQINLALR
jgi:hypothetical protein